MGVALGVEWLSVSGAVKSVICAGELATFRDIGARPDDAAFVVPVKWKVEVDLKFPLP